MIIYDYDIIILLYDIIIFVEKGVKLPKCLDN